MTSEGGAVACLRLLSVSCWWKLRLPSLPFRMVGGSLLYWVNAITGVA